MSISEKTKRMLITRSGGYCANPNCHQDLFPFFETGEITNIEELAHIIGQSEKGPRGKHKLKLAERDEYKNIIVLCPNCHRKIDKNPKLYPDKTLIDWKSNHESAISNCFNVPILPNRNSLRILIDALLRENKLIHETYSIESDFAKNDFSDASELWRILSIQKIIPNNRKILNLLTANKHLLNENELSLLEKFKIHKEGFEYNKLSGDKNSSVILFPKEFNNILLEDTND